MANGCWRIALALAFCAAVGWAGTGSPAVQPPPTPAAATADPEPAGPPRSQVLPLPAAAPPRLKLDIGRYIAEAIARDPSLALPHFEEEVEVRDAYQEALEAHLRGVDVECGASESAPPTTSEMNTFRGATIPPHADFLAAGKEIAKGLRKLFGSKKPRYFLYAVRRASPASGTTAGTAWDASKAAGPVASAPGTSEYVVRDAPISENARSSVPGTSWELVASFRDRESALTALDRMRTGFATPQRAHEDGRLPPWVSTTCRPPRIK